MGFLEVGQAAIAHELAWIPVCFMRHEDLTNVAGGFSRVLASIIKFIFIGRSSLAHTGAATPYGLVLANLSCLLSDNEGLKYALNVKGFAGLRPCLKCFNVWQIGKAPPTQCDVSCMDDRALVPTTREVLHEMIDRLRQAVVDVSNGALPLAALKDMEKAFGINADLRTLLFDREIMDAVDMLSIIRYDWMHGFVSHGTLHDELCRFIQSAKTKAGIQYAEWGQVLDFLPLFRGS